MKGQQEYLLNQAGNTQDINGSIKCGWERISYKELSDSLKNERRNQKRSTVIKMLERYMRKKQREQLSKTVQILGEIGKEATNA